MTDVTFDLRVGGGSAPEVLYGHVKYWAMSYHESGSATILPSPTQIDIVDGQGTAIDVVPTPADDSWLYVFEIFESVNCKTYVFVCEVPDSTAVNFTDLTTWQVPPSGGGATDKDREQDGRLDDAEAKNDEQDTRLGNLEPLQGDVPGSAWRHTDEQGRFLPLGYTADGHLDGHARTIFKADVVNTVDAPTHPVYARAITTETGELLMGFRWDGGVDIPGALSVEREATPQVSYASVPYVPNARVLPLEADTSEMTVWGSSSMMRFGQDALGDLATDHGATGHNEGKGGESLWHTVARLGSAPARVTFPGDLIPSSGEVSVSIPRFDLNAIALKVYTVDVAGVRGTIRPAAGGFKFERATAGDPVELSGPVEAVPVVGHERRNDVTILNLGKNSLVHSSVDESDAVISETVKAVNFLSPLHKKVLVLTHFVNTGMPAVSAIRDRIEKVNDALREAYGPVLVDLAEWVTSEDYWTDTGLTPTQADLDEQALGNKPHSGSDDASHLDVTGNQGLRALITRKLAEIGWY